MSCSRATRRVFVVLLGALVAGCAGGGASAPSPAGSGGGAVAPQVQRLALAAGASAAGSATLPVIQGGGSELPFYPYSSEIAAFDKTAKQADITAYLPNTNSATGQTALLNDDFSCLQNESSGQNGGQCNGTPGGAAADDYAASDLTFTASQIENWAISSVGQSVAGNLIEIPALGYGIAIPIVNSALASNGGAALTDNDLCGIFTGKYTDFSQITDTGLAFAPGPITVVYDTTDGGITLTFTGHLAAVCDPANSAPGFDLGVEATTSLPTIFADQNPPLPVPPNFVGIAGEAAIANDLAGLGGSPVSSAVAYVTPDYTSLVATSPVRLSNGLPSPLLVASVVNGKTAQLPTSGAIGQALADPTVGRNLKAPSNGPAAANPGLWIPFVQKAGAGYPIVGYTILDFAQCYGNAKIGAGILAFLKAHYGTTDQSSIQVPDGFAPIPNSAKTGDLLGAIQGDILTNKLEFNTNIQNTTACPGLPGR